MKRQVQIIELIGIIGKRKGRDGKDQTLELNLVSLDGGSPMFDIRWWSDGIKPRYGVVLTEKSLAELGTLIDSYFEEKYK